MRPIHKNTVADALERLTEEESHGIFDGSVRDLVRARLVEDTVFSMDGSDLHITEHYPGAGHITVTREMKDKWGRDKTVTSIRYGYLLLSLRGVESNIVVAANVKGIGASEHPQALALVRAAKAAGARVRILVIDGAYCVGPD